MTDRIRRLLHSLSERPWDALLITDEINVRYLSGFTGDSSWLLITDDDVTILSDRRYETQIASQCPTLTASIRPPNQKLTARLAEVLADRRLGSIGFESDHTSVSTLRMWETDAPAVTFTATASLVEDLRAIKDDGEIALIRRAIDVAQRAFIAVTHSWNSRMTERDVSHSLEAAMRSMGASGVSFSPIVGVQPNGALPHYQPGDVPLGDCPTLLIDWGARVGGYCSDLTRTLHRPGLSGSAMERFRSAYQAVSDAHQAAIETIRDGVDAQAVDAAARDLLTRAGYGDAFKHGLGHGFGLQIHEEPRMSQMSQGALRAGMVVTVEPGVYFENEFGIRIEDDILVTPDGHEVLSSLPKGLDECVMLL